MRDVNEAIGRLTAEVSRCTMALEDLKNADAEMHIRMEEIVAYVERSRGRDRILAFLASFFLAAVGTGAVMVIRADSGIAEARAEVVDARHSIAQTNDSVREIARSVETLHRSMETWQAVSQTRLESLEENTRRATSGRPGRRSPGTLP